MKTTQVTINGIFQCVAIFILISMAGALWFELNKQLILYVVIGVYAILYLFRKKYRVTSIIVISVFLFVYIYFLRLLNRGGIGMQDWRLFVGQILIVHLAYRINQDKFLERYINITVIWELFSLMFWVIELVRPEILRLLFKSVNFGSGAAYYGKILYVYRPMFSEVRNTGIYTEPGRYTAIIISVLFILLFFKNNLNIKEWKYYFCLVTSFVTMISTGSTTGYIAGIILIACYLSKHQTRENSKVKRRIIAIIILVLGILLMDYYFNTNNSLVGKVLFQKIEGTHAAVASSSGGARLRMIEIAANIIKEYPLGAGHDIARKQMSMVNIHGAGLIYYMASMGIVTIMILFIWIVRPFFVNKSYYLEGVCFILLYINIGLAQTYAIYTPLLILPLVVKGLLDKRNNRIYYG
jgi:hypothetical protein